MRGSSHNFRSRQAGVGFERGVDLKKAQIVRSAVLIKENLNDRESLAHSLEENPEAFLALSDRLLGFPAQPGDLQSAATRADSSRALNGLTR